MNLDTLFAPRSIAVVGASADPAKLSSQPLRILQETGFTGRLYVVNPRRRQVRGVTSVPDPAALPEPVDVGLVVVPSDQVPQAVEALAARGTRHTIVLSAGFNETVDGHRHAQRLREIIAETGLCLVGPNSEGVWSLPGRALMTHGSAALGRELRLGPVSILSQSGSIGAAIARSLLDSGTGIRHLVSLGNELGVTLVDCLEYLVQEAASRVVLLFIEGLTDGQRLPTLLRAAQQAGMVVIGVKAGLSPAGREAIQTHTGKLATPGRVYGDVIRSCGHLVADGIAEALAMARTLAAAPHSVDDDRGDQRGLGIVSASGGSRALLVDEAWRRGVPLAKLSASTVAAVAAAMAGRGVAENPIDVDVAALYDRARFLEILTAVAADPTVGTLVVQLANRGAQQLPELAEDLIAVRARGTAVVVALLLDTASPEVVRRLAGGGVVVTSDPSAAIAQAALLTGVSGAAGGEPATALTGDVAKDEDVGAVVPWADRMALVTSAGMSVPPWRIVRGAGDLAAAADEVALPWVLKALPEQANHKSDQGLVRLGLTTLTSAQTALESLQATLGRGAPVLLQQMVPGGVELILASRRDPELGPVLVLGRGGVAVEVDDDLIHLPGDAQAEEILAGLRRLRGYPLLAGFRGSPPADLAAVVTAARGLGDALSADPGLTEVEINPLIVQPEGGGAVAVDVRIRRQ